MDISHKLPEKAPEGLLPWVMQNFGMDELGGELMTFSRESIDIEEMEWGMMMHPSDIDKYYKSIKRHWGARCTCTACGYEFIAGYQAGGILMLTGKDGLTYPGWCDEYTAEATEYTAGDYVPCPSCDCNVKLVRASEIRKGFTKQLMVCSPERVGDRLALIFWMVYRTYNAATRLYYERVEPFEAVTIEARRTMKHYTHVWHSMGGASLRDKWTQTSRFYNPEDRAYHDYGSVNNKKVGAVVYKNPAHDLGTTAEKTGLMAYIMAGGQDPIAYLHLWKVFPAIENLIKGGWTAAIDKLIMGASGSDVARRAKRALDMQEVKPNRILHMSKEEYRTADRGISGNELETWGLCWQGRESCTFTELMSLIGEVGCATAGRFVEKTNEGMPYYEVKQVAKYLRRQCHGKLPKRFVAEQLLDYRRMMADSGVKLMTEEELWPANVVAAHDRASDMLMAAKKTQNQKAFDEVRKRLADLEWTDGDLCIRIPKSDGELVAEGTILRHCVGGYGEQHSKGEKVILFVRHYRRPERSYYTLNEDLTALHPKRIQLHGYGNERHGDRKQYSHRIPERVTAFVARWERDVLAPWLIQQSKAKETA